MLLDRITDRSRSLKIVLAAITANRDRVVTGLRGFLEPVLQPGDHAIELTWLCEYDLPGEDDELPTTWLALDVDGVGEIWEDHRPGGRFHEEGRDLSRCNRYAIKLTPPLRPP